MVEYGANPRMPGAFDEQDVVVLERLVGVPNPGAQVLHDLARDVGLGEAARDVDRAHVRVGLGQVEDGPHEDGVLVGRDALEERRQDERAVRASSGQERAPGDLYVQAKTPWLLPGFARGTEVDETTGLRYRYECRDSQLPLSALLGYYSWLDGEYRSRISRDGGSYLGRRPETIFRPADPADPAEPRLWQGGWDVTALPAGETVLTVTATGTILPLADSVDGVAPTDAIDGAVVSKLMR